jgi:hypothetical protein
VIVDLVGKRIECHFKNLEASFHSLFFCSESEVVFQSRQKINRLNFKTPEAPIEDIVDFNDRTTRLVHANGDRLLKLCLENDSITRLNLKATEKPEF